MSQILSSPLSGWLNISASGAAFSGARDLSALVAVEFLPAGGQQVYFNFVHNHDNAYSPLGHSHPVTSGVLYWSSVGAVSSTTTVVDFTVPFPVPSSIKGFDVYRVTDSATTLLFSRAAAGVVYGFRQSNTYSFSHYRGSYAFVNGSLVVTCPNVLINYVSTEYLWSFYL